MPYESMFTRIVAKLGALPVYGIRDARLNSEETAILGNVAKFRQKYGLSADLFKKETK
jgi:hypothetical protein